MGPGEFWKYETKICEDDTDTETPTADIDSKSSFIYSGKKHINPMKKKEAAPNKANSWIAGGVNTNLSKILGNRAENLGTIFEAEEDDDRHSLSDTGPIQETVTPYVVPITLEKVMEAVASTYVKKPSTEK